MAKKDITIDALRARAESDAKLAGNDYMSLFSPSVRLTPDDLAVNSDSTRESVHEIISEKSNNQNSRVEIEIDKLVESGFNFFSPYSEEEMANLVSSIESIGLQEPIIVRPGKCCKAYSVPEDAFEIIAGHNRVTAFKKLGRNTIPCRIVDADDTTATLLVAQTNIQRERRPSIFEWARMYRATYDMYKRDVTENFKGGESPKSQSDLLGEKGETTLAFVAKKYGMAEKTMQRRIRLAYVIPELENAYLKRQFPTLKQLINLSYMAADSQEYFFEKYSSSTNKEWITDEISDNLYKQAKLSQEWDHHVTPANIDKAVLAASSKAVKPNKTPKISFSTENTKIVPSSVKKKDRNRYIELALKTITDYLEAGTLDETAISALKKLTQK